MKVLLISDIHGNLPALNAIMNKINPVDKVICLGDLVGYYPYINEVIEIISSLDNLICIMGNHDYVLLNDNTSTGSRSADMAISIQRKIISSKNKDYLMKLHKLEKYIIDDRKCFIFHGSPMNPLYGREPFWEDGFLEEGIYFCGHSHKPFFKNNPEQGWMVINPGSCGLPRDGDPRASYAILNTINWHIDFYRVEYPIDIVAKQCRIAGLPEKFWKSLEAGVWISGS